jgi:hypothetical protein
MHSVGIKGKSKGLMAEFADFENGCEKHSSGRQPRITNLMRANAVICLLLGLNQRH